jgi:hypothetical protein
MGHGIIAPVTFGVGRVTKEDTRDRTRGEFVRSGGRGARITKAPEDPKTIVRRRGTEEELMRSIIPARATWADVKKEGGGGESVRPEPRGNVGVEKQRTDTIVKSANNALSTAILLGRVGTSEAEDGAV